VRLRGTALVVQLTAQSPPSKGRQTFELAAVGTTELPEGIFGLKSENKSGWELPTRGTKRHSLRILRFKTIGIFCLAAMGLARHVVLLESLKWA
jgi:hypothetical protein